MDWASRRVLAWRLSNTMEADFCVEALEDALSRFGCPEIFNTDQGSQFTGYDFTGVLKREGIKISMDGKGRFMDNIFIERRSLKYEEVFIKPRWPRLGPALAPTWRSTTTSVRTSRSITRRPARCSSVDMWTIGPGADRLRFPHVSGRGRKHGEMLAFAHMPTGPTAATRNVYA